jgi:hypothetical protein
MRPHSRNGLPPLVELLRAPVEESWVRDRLPLVVAFAAYVGAVVLFIAVQIGVLQ